MEYILNELKKLKEQYLFREEKVVLNREDKYVFINGKKLINFSSNDYLNISDNKTMVNAVKDASDKYGWGATSSRLISGTFVLHKELENKIAEFMNREAAIFYNSGYFANFGFMNSFLTKDDYVLFDKLCHASLIDSIRQHTQNFHPFMHCNIENLEKKLNTLRSKNAKSRILIVTDSIFSMDGDIAPIKKIYELALKLEASLYIDEAHATGVFGENGRGILERIGLLGKKNIFSMNTMSKAFGSIGAFIAGDRCLIDLLRNKSRSYIYTTALPAPICAANIVALEIVKNNKKSRKELFINSENLRNNLIMKGFDVGKSETQIIPIILNDIIRTLELSKMLFENGYFVPAIRYPTVKKGQERLRISITTACNEKDFKNFLEIISRYR